MATQPSLPSDRDDSYEQLPTSRKRALTKARVSNKQVPCGSGDVRITSSLLPHGSTGPATKVRRTMLPWYVAVKEDLATSETEESGSFQDVALAHQNLGMPPASPSGHGHHYGTIPFRFPAAVELANLGALSDALVCRRRWNSPAVLCERDIVLGTNAKDFINSWRIKAVKEVLESFQIVKDTHAMI